MDTIDAAIDLAERHIGPPTFEEYISTERLDHSQRTDVFMHIIELAAMQRLVDTPGYRDQYPRGLQGYTDHIEPLIRTIQAEGFGAGDAVIQENWRVTVEADALHQRSPRGGRLRPFAWEDLANAAYSRLTLTNDHQMTLSSKLAIWTLYIAEPQESIDFCVRQGMLPYLADAPALVRFLAEDRVRNGISADEDALAHISNVRPYIRRYMRDYALERAGDLNVD